VEVLYYCQDMLQIEIQIPAFRTDVEYRLKRNVSDEEYQDLLKYVIEGLKGHYDDEVEYAIENLEMKKKPEKQ
jgi:hypothetical protein